VCNSCTFIVSCHSRCCHQCLGIHYENTRKFPSTFDVRYRHHYFLFITIGVDRYRYIQFRHDGFSGKLSFIHQHSFRMSYWFVKCTYRKSPRHSLRNIVVFSSLCNITRFMQSTCCLHYFFIIISTSTWSLLSNSIFSFWFSLTISVYLFCFIAYSLLISVIVRRLYGMRKILLPDSNLYVHDN
jgi:hypothetical protein